MSHLKINGRQAAAVLGVSDSFVFALAKEGLITKEPLIQRAHLKIDSAWASQLAREIGPIRGPTRAYELRRILKARAAEATKKATPVPAFQQSLPMPEAGAYSVRRAASFLRVAQTTLNDMAMHGLLPTRRQGKLNTRLVSASLVEAVAARVGDVASDRAELIRQALRELAAGPVDVPVPAQKTVPRTPNRQDLGAAIEHLLQATDLLLGIAGRAAAQMEAKP